LIPKFGDVQVAVKAPAPKGPRPKGQSRKNKKRRQQNNTEGRKAQPRVEIKVGRTKIKRQGGKRAPRFEAMEKITEGLTAKNQTQKALMCLMDPMNAPDVRFPLGWNAIPTTILKPFQRIPVPFVPDGTTTTNPQTLPNTEMMWFLKRDPLHCFRYYHPNHNNQRFIYNFFGSGAGSNHRDTPSKQWTMGDGSGDSIVAETKTYIHNPYCKPEASFVPNGTMWLPYTNGKSNGAKFYLVPKGAEFSLDTTARGGTGTLEFGLDRLNADGSVDLNVVVENGPIAVNTSTITSLVAPTDGKYAVWVCHASGVSSSYKSLEINAMNLAGGPTGATIFPGMWAELPFPGFEGVVGTLPSVKMIGLAVRYMNSDARLYRGGRVVGAQIPPGRNPEEFIYPYNGNAPPSVVGTYGYGLLDSYADSQEEIADRGDYLWLKPSADEDWKFKEYWTLDANVLVDAGSPYNAEEGFLACGITGDQSALNGTFELMLYMEATTTDTTRPIAKSDINPVLMLELQAIISKAPWFFENPLHVSSIAAFIKKAGSFISNNFLKFSPYINRGMRLMRDVSEAM